jgi:hypothetical protein
MAVEPRTSFSSRYVDCGEKPKISKTTANYHTHGGNIYSSTAQHFSHGKVFYAGKFYDGDVEGYISEKVDGYLGTPTGKFLVWRLKEFNALNRFMEDGEVYVDTGNYAKYYGYQVPHFPLVATSYF